MDRRRVGLILGAILVVALGLRLGYVLSQRDDVLFSHPVLDEERYVEAARGLVAGHGEARPYWQPPGIVYALAAVFEVAGPGLIAPRIVAVLISVASCLLVFLLGRRLFSERIGLAAAAIVALHGVLVFECGELLPATWLVFWDLLALWLLLRAVERARWLDAFGAGLVLGVSAVFSPTILPFVPIAGVLVRRPAAIAALLVGAMLPIAPVAVRNYQHGGELVMISTNGGLNLYIGNNANYRDTFALRPGRHWEELTTEPDRHGIAQPGAASTYFTHEALGFATTHPVAETALLARKLYLFGNGGEIPRDTDLYAARESSSILSALVWPIHFPDGLLIPAALVGIAALWRERRRLAAPLGLLAVLALVTAVFFVTSRHRAPALPLFALFAAAGVVHWTWRHAVAAAVLVVALNVPTWETGMSYAGELDFYRGIAARDQHDAPAARVALRRSTEDNPLDARAWFELGNALDGRDAVAAWQRAAELDPWDSRPRRRIAQMLAQAGDLDGAIAALEASIAANLRDAAHYAPDHLNLAFMHARRGHVEAAIRHLAAAVQADPAYVHRAAPSMAQAAHADPTIDPAFATALDAVVAGGRP